MRLSFHPAVQKDDAISDKLGDRFFSELTASFDSVLENPQRGHIEKADVRRVNLTTFPFHFLYRVLADRVRITVVKHHKRDPKFGMSRR